MRVAGGDMTLEVARLCGVYDLPDELFAAAAKMLQHLPLARASDVAASWSRRA